MKGLAIGAIAAMLLATPLAWAAPAVDRQAALSALPHQTNKPRQPNRPSGSGHHVLPGMG